MHKVYLLIGSNRGEKKILIEKAQERLGLLSVNPVLSSSFYESEPWGFESDEWFLNKAILIETELSPESLLRQILNIETDLGRVRGAQKEGYESREIDIDILLYDNMVIESEILTIPHPRMHLRKFVLEPLMEINPDIIHPVLLISVKDLYLNCPDKSAVRRT
ncbi:MAG: 2-amino-4-hydroxy-6-hydroxymethyldihydropteridin epyrophosphokinase [uncultured bacterium]|nr:MAG: 2-amino-4-hydroxy-6-hydroxymethyldihydropteridin epyrophosphokinase [uncultured bacterium]